MSGTTAANVINGNTVTAGSVPLGVPIRLTATGGGRWPQRVTVTDGGQSVAVFTAPRLATGTVGQSTVTAQSGLQVIFEFNSLPNYWAPSKVKVLGTYTSSTTGLILGAENGDDTDYDDCILTMNWG